MKRKNARRNGILALVVLLAAADVSKRQVIDRQLASAGGLFLSSGFHPGGMEFLFRESPDQGLAFALGLQGEMTAQEQEHTPDFFLLLHGASFLYGLVGSEERTFPLLSSSETVSYTHL